MGHFPYGEDTDKLIMMQKVDVPISSGVRTDLDVYTYRPHPVAPLTDDWTLELTLEG